MAPTKINLREVKSVRLKANELLDERVYKSKHYRGLVQALANPGDAIAFVATDRHQLVFAFKKEAGTETRAVRTGAKLDLTLMGSYAAIADLAIKGLHDWSAKPLEQMVAKLSFTVSPVKEKKKQPRRSTDSKTR